MNIFRADMHCHSTCSDGTCSPQEIVELAVSRGLKGLSITDHDSVQAYKTVIPIAKDHGLELITGVEFSTVHKKETVHILAYSFHPDDQLIQEFCANHQIRRANRNREILKKLKDHDMPIDEEEIIEDVQGEIRTIGRPHIAKAMIRHGYVSTINEAFKKYIGDEGPCYSQGESYSTEETIELIHKSKGLAFIAHPHLNNNASLLNDILQLDFDGIECYYALFKPEQNKRWLKIANKKNWLISGGSDFHGDIKPNIPLGCSWIPEENFQILQKHYQDNLKQSIS